MATSPSATPQPKSGSGPGCLLGLLLLPVVVVIGLVVGTLLNPGDDPDDTAAVTILEGTLEGTEWRVDATRDVEGATCAFLYQGDDDAPLNGACTLTPQDVTYGDRTVVFGKAASDDEEVTVVFEDGSTTEIATVTAEGIEGRFYAQVVDGDLDAETLG